MFDHIDPRLFPSRALQDELGAISSEFNTYALTRPQPGEPEQPEAEWLRDDRDEGLSYPMIRMPIPEVSGVLYTGPIPGRFRDSLTAVHLGLVAKAGVQQLLCLTPLVDVAEQYGMPSYEEAARACFGDHFHTLPILDYEVPTDDVAFDAEIIRLIEVLQRGEHVLVHCGAGCGRTGLFASCLLVALGWDPLDAVRHYRRHRGCGPESGSQVAWVLRFAQRLGSAPSKV